MSKKLLMNNYAENDEIILCENYSPNGQHFYLWQDKSIDWDNYELYINTDLNDYTQNEWDNVLSIGESIENWDGGWKWHVYFRRGQIRFQCININSRDFALTNTSSVEIIINKQGAYLNGVYLDGFRNPETNKTFKTKPISIGSQNGSCGVALYNKVSLRKYQERG